MLQTSPSIASTAPIESIKIQTKIIAGGKEIPISNDNPSEADSKQIVDEISLAYQNDKEIAIIVEDLDQEQPPTNKLVVWAGKYRAEIRKEGGYVGGCIERNQTHINLHLRDSKANKDIVNIHLVSWWENGPQFGIYNTGTRKFCVQTRGKFTALKDSITNFFRSVGIPLAYAAMMGAAVAYVCMGAMPILAF